MNKYRIEIFWSDADEGFIGICPEFPGLSVFGYTRQEAFKEIEPCIEAFMDICKEDGIMLPEPLTHKSF